MATNPSSDLDAVRWTCEPPPQEAFRGTAQPGKIMTQRAASLAKLSRPNLTGILSRDRLFSVLDEGREKSIIWVSGPPGCGKTTLVADYLDTWALDCIWYQVDQGDADIATFFHYMAKAVPDVDDDKHKPLPTLSPQYHSNLDAFTRRYFRELFSRLTPPFALVFDNYQDLPLYIVVTEDPQKGDGREGRQSERRLEGERSAGQSARSRAIARDLPNEKDIQAEGHHERREGGDGGGEVIQA